MGSLFATLLATLTAFTILPIGLAVWAAIDLMRSSRNRLWLVVILAVPVIGPILSLIAGRMPGVAALEVSSVERAAAKRHLATLQVQLANWRGPALLVEAGEQLLILGRAAEAEAHLREARAAGAPLDDASFPLAQALAAQGRAAEAVPLLDELLAAHPGHADGAALELLGRCLDEAGDLARAETTLRQALERRSPPSLRLRLASVLVRVGQRDEAIALARQTREDIETLAPALRRVASPWLAYARKIERGNAAPFPTITPATGARRQVLSWLLVAAACLTVVGALTIAPVACGLRRMSSGAEEFTTVMQEIHAGAERMAALNASCPTGWLTSGADAATWQVPGEALDRYLRVRATLAAPLAELRAASRAAERAEAEPDDEELGLNMDGHVAALMAHRAALEQLTRTLRAEGSCPRELEALLGIVEWRFLRREQATTLGLAEYERDDWASANYLAGQLIPASEGDEAMAEWAKEVARDRDLARLEVAALSQRALANTALAPETLALLEPRRAELSALDPAEVPDLLALLARETEVPW